MGKLIIEVEYHNEKIRQKDITDAVSEMEGVINVMVWRIQKPHHI